MAKSKMNKYEEALNHIGLCYVASEGKRLEASEEYMDDYYTLRELVNKEKPIMVEEKDFEYDVAICPKCGATIGWEDKYCRICGQRIIF